MGLFWPCCLKPFKKHMVFIGFLSQLWKGKSLGTHRSFEGVNGGGWYKMNLG